jgi:hypothetical protein
MAGLTAPFLQDLNISFNGDSFATVTSHLHISRFMRDHRSSFFFAVQVKLSRKELENRILRIPI